MATSLQGMKQVQEERARSLWGMTTSLWVIKQVQQENATSPWDAATSPQGMAFSLWGMATSPWGTASGMAARIDSPRARALSPTLAPPALGAPAEPPDSGDGRAGGARLAGDRPHGDEPDAGRVAVSGGRAVRASSPRRGSGISASSVGYPGGARGAGRRSLHAGRRGVAGRPRPDGLDERILFLSVQDLRRSGGRGADGRSLLSSPRQPGGPGLSRPLPLSL